jgi:hypothetical protein
MLPAIVLNKAEKNGSVFFEFYTAHAMNIQETLHGLRKICGQLN